ncbi:MAG: hypothetical protein QOJ86_1480 [Bradyrhizobium sp.]|jgi:vacuolar-type H+-ATPase subunit I/STV1|nr:hypothetical protein [Bradyrhizobium sp.]
MTQRVSDEREHRRGLVLGLTLAEVLLLLMFLLLLALGSKVERYRLEAESSQEDLKQANAAMETLKPLQEALSKADGSINSVSELIQRLARIKSLEARVAQLGEENSSLSAQASAIKSLGKDAEKKLQKMADVLNRAAQLDPSDPASVVAKSLDILARLGASTLPEQVKPLNEMIADGEQKQRAQLIEADRDKIRLQLDSMIRSGNGLTYPPCWVAQNGQTEYIYDVTTRDGGLIVRDVIPQSRLNDPALKFVDAMQKGSLISEKAFNDATSRLFAYSKQQNCRFYTVLRDETGPQSKERYKHLRAAIESHFYIRISRGVASDGPREPTPASRDVEPRGGITLGLPWANQN